MLNRVEAFIFLAEGFEEIEAIATIDVIRRASISLSIVSITGSEFVAGSHGVTIKADGVFEQTDFSSASLLILPGGMPGAANLQSHEGLAKLLKQFYSDENKRLAAICAAPKVFGHLGFLKDKHAICYPGFETELDGALLAIDPVVTDQNITTAKGPAFAVDFGLKLVELLKGKEEANKVAAAMLVK